MFFDGIWPGQLIAGKYRIKNAVGEGGMGIVLRAKHLDLDRVVAIKVMRAELAQSDDVVERMLLEARAAAMLRSEHVARVLDVGRLETGSPYIVMEYLEGDDLNTLLAHERRLEPMVAVDFVLQACEAVAEAHAHGIVHRDLKPENLFLTSRADGVPCIKVLDFGISRQRDVQRRHVTNPSAALGSPHYMSPEQMGCRTVVDARADIWSLGAILYELMSGEHPFEADGLPQVCMRVMNDPPTPLSSHVKGIPPELEAIVMRCLEKAPEARFADVGELAVALMSFGTEATQEYPQRIRRVLCGVRVSLPDMTRTSRHNLPLGTPSYASLLPAIMTRPGASQQGRRTLTTAVVSASLTALVVGLVVHSCTRVAPSAAQIATQTALQPEATTPIEREPHAVPLPLLTLTTARALPEPARAEPEQEPVMPRVTAPASASAARPEVEPAAVANPLTAAEALFGSRQ